MTKRSRSCSVGTLPVALLIGFLLQPLPGYAQSAGSDAARQESEARPTGLPRRINWTFNLDASWGSFGFANSLFQNPKEGVGENPGDQWFEGAVKPALTGRRALANSSEFYGTASAVGERTYGSQPSVLGGDFSSFQAEDLSFGWRSGTSVGSGEHVLDFTVGRTPFTLGHGMLLWDGAAEGGSRGGYWTNARKSFEFAAIGRVHPGPHKVEAFYLDRDDLPESETGTRLWGANYELSVGERSTFGATYMTFFADAEVNPGRDGLDVVNLRAYTAPVAALPDLSFDVEYASERNGDVLGSTAWTLQGAYEMSTVFWKPTLSYRYASFQGDDPETARNESFDPLLPGFSDWGSWWQGEVVGEYIAANSNLISHQVRAHVAPSDAVEGGLIVYKFTLDQPGAIAPGVTSGDLAAEFDIYADWTINANVSASFVLAFARPGLAAQQAFDRTQTFSYGMVFLAYRY